MKRVIFIFALLALVMAAGLVVRVGGALEETGDAEMTIDRPQKPDLSGFSDAPLSRKIRLLFIHHSCGGNLLADEGPENGENCIYESHPLGGGMRRLLEESGYEVHEASYGSSIGQNTDIFDWPPKFRDQMDRILSCNRQDDFYEDKTRNQVVLFKSCYPNNLFVGEGRAPGNPDGPDLTLWNARAAYHSLLEEFAHYPSVLFVCLTAPPIAPKVKSQPFWKIALKKLMGHEKNSRGRSGPLARAFNNWLADREGWLKDYPLDNVVVFDLYDLLTGEGESNFSVYPTGDGLDSHPSLEGNRKAARALVPFLNRAVRRAGIVSKTNEKLILPYELGYTFEKGG